MLRKSVEALYGLHVALVVLLTLLLFAGPVALSPGAMQRHRWAGRAMRFALGLCGVRVRVEGLHRLPAGPCVAIANHASYVDGPVLLGLLPPRFTFVVDDGVRAWPLIGKLVERAGVSFISRGDPRRAASQTRALVRHLRDGESVLIFPEGGFRDQPGLQRFKRGAFAMASGAEVPLVPMLLSGTRQFYGGGRRLPRPSRLTLRILDPVSSSTDLEALREQLRLRMLALYEEGDAEPTVQEACAG